MIQELGEDEKNSRGGSCPPTSRAYVYAGECTPSIDWALMISCC